MKITAKVTGKHELHSRLSVWVNGGLIVNPGGICLRNEEVEEFLDHLKISPTKIKAKLRSMIEEYERIARDGDYCGDMDTNLDKRIVLQVVLGYIEQEERELNLDIGTWEVK